MHTLPKPNRVAIAAFVLPLLIAAPTAAEIIPVAQQARGLSINQVQCAAMPQAVWVDTMGESFCIRYYASTAGGNGTRPVVFLQGDMMWPYDKKTLTFTPKADDKDINTDDLIRSAERFSRDFETTAIYLARPGNDGSSGSHNVKHSLLELRAVDVALEAIKHRYGLKGFHLIGQSGGSILVGGLLALRRDIGCAVPGAGRLSRIDDWFPNPNLKYFSAADAAPVIAHNGARILVVDDPLDKRTAWENDTIFVDKVLEAGGQAELFAVAATDDDHHGVLAYATAALAGCLRGANHREISADLMRVQDRLLVAKGKTAVRLFR
jgi:hypothetical protein